MARYLNAREAAEYLGISRQTLYAYVSRGLIRSAPLEKDRRARGYYREDVVALKARHDRRGNPDEAVRSALYWGAPVLDSSITLIRDGHLYYRGVDIEVLVDSPLEATALLLWSGEEQPLSAFFAARKNLRLESISTEPSLPPFEAMFAMLPRAAYDEPGAYDFRRGAMMETGVRIVTRLAHAAAGAGERVAPLPEQDWTVAEYLRRAWSPGRPEVLEAIEKALIVCADHELNVSTFCARCVASARASLHAAVIAGMAALSGVRHGRHTEQVEALFDEAGEAGAIRETLSAWQRRGGASIDFSHPLYPDGDPRGRILMEIVRRLRPAAPEIDMIEALADALNLPRGRAPVVDVALVALARAFDLPRGASLALFALGRSLGWIAHAIEQIESDRGIRPRARYVGILPKSV